MSGGYCEDVEEEALSSALPFVVLLVANKHPCVEYLSTVLCTVLLPPFPLSPLLGLAFIIESLCARLRMTRGPQTPLNKINHNRLLLPREWNDLFH